MIEYNEDSIKRAWTDKPCKKNVNRAMFESQGRHPGRLRRLSYRLALVVALIITTTECRKEERRVGTMNPNCDCHRLRQECELCGMKDGSSENSHMQESPDPSKWCSALFADCELAKFLRNGCKWREERRLGVDLINPSQMCHYIIDECELCEYVERGCLAEELHWRALN